MTQQDAPISASKGGVPLDAPPPNQDKEVEAAGGLPFESASPVTPENPSEADPKPLPSDRAFEPGFAERRGDESMQTGGSAISRDAVAQEPDDKDTDPNRDGPHGTPDNTWSTVASDPEADVDASLDISRLNPQGVDGVRSTNS
jgi:hypothetical protein